MDGQDFIGEGQSVCGDQIHNREFTRESAAGTGAGVSIIQMRRRAPSGECCLTAYLIADRQSCASDQMPVWFGRMFRFSIEGGGQLVLSRQVLAVGISERTTAQAIEQLALNLFAGQKEIRKVVAVEIPKSRAFMHLDTVFTMVDRNK